MDNLSSHKQAGVVETKRDAGAEAFYLPRTLPTSIPSSKVFAKLKTLLRYHAERTTEALWDRIGILMDAFTPTECANYIRHCGYRAN